METDVGENEGGGGALPPLPFVWLWVCFNTFFKHPNCTSSLHEAMQAA